MSSSSTLDPLKLHPLDDDHSQMIRFPRFDPAYVEKLTAEKSLRDILAKCHSRSASSSPGAGGTEPNARKERYTSGGIKIVHTPGPSRATSPQSSLGSESGRR
ncbi:hypothetical protein DV738_g2191, partial [Chaetothyriales sp. CBS 135597]